MKEMREGIRIAVFSIVFTAFLSLTAIGLLHTGGITIQIVNPQDSLPTSASVIPSRPDELTAPEPAPEPPAPEPPAEVPSVESTTEIKDLGAITSVGIPNGLSAKLKNSDGFSMVLVEGKLSANDATRYVNLIDGKNTELLLLGKDGFVVGVSKLEASTVRVSLDGTSYKLRHQCDVVCSAEVVSRVEIYIPSKVPKDEAVVESLVDESQEDLNAVGPEIGTANETHQG